LSERKNGTSPRGRTAPVLGQKEKGGAKDTVNACGKEGNKAGLTLGKWGQDAANRGHTFMPHSRREKREEDFKVLKLLGILRHFGGENESELLFYLHGTQRPHVHVKEVTDILLPLLKGRERGTMGFQGHSSYESESMSVVEEGGGPKRTRNATSSKAGKGSEVDARYPGSTLDPTGLFRTRKKKKGGKGRKRRVSYKGLGKGAVTVSTGDRTKEGGDSVFDVKTLKGTESQGGKNCVLVNKLASWLRNPCRRSIRQRKRKGERS